MSSRPPLGIQLLALLLACYAMAGVAVGVVLPRAHVPFRRPLLLGAAAALIVTAGSAALATWRLERRAPAWLVACGLAGAAFSLALAFAWPPWMLTREVWAAAILGAVMFVAFLGIAAVYVRLVLRASEPPDPGRRM